MGVGYSHGFTLVELVLVIVLLGIMATFSSQFIAIGGQIYGDASQRSELMSDARFAMERLNREVRDALPGSERIETLTGEWAESGPCLRFWPISTSSRYLTLNRVIAGNSGALELVMATPTSAVNPLLADADAVRVGDLLVVFPVPDKQRSSLVNGCDYGRCVAQITDVLPPQAGSQTLRYRSSELLAGLSPGQRVYVANQQVRYCVEGERLTRRAAPLSANLPTAPSVMAQGLQEGRFSREPTAFNADGELGVRLVFSGRGESVTFNHKIGVLNVP
ncbi:prepilin-type N-terminal cleavage/methylation domain-containing protein [Aeromonas cavernicola]|uniref:MSHA biogenesis protein MshO n=1 Tax=Aeromonas cavernicola TaxID=1006623 RepID=A0A2H9U269_9GAMM|nr:prepilin-type N-terminal cleavage/methylation domain-containing protein [Aeromonas cavernicola]PJG58157.1 MSHA biogenesis protein MshO [Aeromonas cavernicola]